MKDAELVYSLYVQANPVLDPDLLPLSRDEAALLTLERSPDMTMQDQLERHEPTGPPRRRRLVAAMGAAAVLVFAIAAIAVLVNGGSGPVAAADADPTVVFDAASCSYEGPTAIEEGMVEFSMSNSADHEVGFALIRMAEPALSQELDALPVGSETALGPDAPLPDGHMRFIELSPNESRTNPWAMASGTYLLDCVAGDPTDYVWRVAKIEIAAP